MADDNNTIPFARFNEVNDQKVKLATQVETLTKQLKTLEDKLSTAVASVEATKAEYGAKLADLTLTHETDRVMLSEGVSEDGVDYFRFKYGQVSVEKGQEKPAFSEWFKGLKEERPSLVQSFIAQQTGTQKTGTQKTGTQKTGTQKTGTQQTGTQQTGTQQTGTQKKPPVDQSRNGVQSGVQIDPSTLTPTQIAKMSPEQFKTMGASIWQNLPGLVAPSE